MIICHIGFIAYFVFVIGACYYIIFCLHDIRGQWFDVSAWEIQVCVLNRSTSLSLGSVTLIYNHSSSAHVNNVTHYHCMFLILSLLLFFNFIFPNQNESKLGTDSNGVCHALRFNAVAWGFTYYLRVFSERFWVVHKDFGFLNVLSCHDFKSQISYELLLIFQMSMRS